MKNWSRHIRWNPAIIHYPDSEEEIQEIVHQATQSGQKIRIVGSAHSFMPLSKTSDILISLDRFQGLSHIDPDSRQVTVKAGTKLFLLNDLLHEQGLALENLGDINQQSIAGTIATGTHGTGIAFGNISTQVIRIRFVNGKGQIRECSASEEPSLFKAAQISLGVLGIITQITIQCVPAYKLHLQIEKARLTDTLQNIHTLNKSNRNFEFYWFPNSDYVMTKASNHTDNSPDKHGLLDYFQEMILENYAFKAICELTTWFPATSNWASRFSANTISSHRKTNHSHKVYVTPRLVRFNEMEYNVPLDAYEEVMKELVNWVNHNNKKVHFPIENRFVKKDDIYLSPAYERDSAYIACHVYSKKDFTYYFKNLEAIFQRYDGRPHWGKINTIDRAFVEKQYPAFPHFQKHRIEEDPDDLFLSPYLKKLFA